MTYTENTIDNGAEFNHINVQVFQLFEDLEAAGEVTHPRGLTCKGANIAELDINPLYPLMDFQPRPFNYRYFAGEIGWYLMADPKIDFINHFSSFWTGICPNGRANSNYGHILFGPHPSTVRKEAYLINDNVNQLEWVYNSLAKDKNSRQAVAFVSSPFYQRNDGTKDFVCTLYVSFWISKGHLDMKVQMRSNDIFFGLTYDAPWFSTLHQSMFLNLQKIYPDLKLGMYYHCADNIHFYDRHFDLVEKILDAPLGKSISMKLKTPVFEFENGKFKLSEISKKYIEQINEIVKNGVPKDQKFWQDFLQNLYDFS